MTTGLVLSGGGARAAYQVGVLKGVSEILPKQVYNPFPVICGTSAGAINALAIAGRSGHFRLRMRKLQTIWQNLKVEDVYRTDVGGVLKNSIKVALSLLHSGYSIGKPVALLDNSPLRVLLDSHVRFRHIDEAIASGELHAVSVTAMSYNTGQSITFFQGTHRLDPWTRFRRVGVREGLTIEHLMASSAIPFLFPAHKINSHYYGDGSLRQLKPLSSALHLGAKRIFVVGVSDNPRHKNPSMTAEHSPSIAQVMGHLFNTAFIDTIESDLETLRAINCAVKNHTDEEREKLGIGHLKYVDFVSISPSTPIDQIALKYLDELPRSIKFFLRALGATPKGGGASTASYLLFQKNFCNELISLGYRDALEQADEITDFFVGDRETLETQPEHP